MYIKYQADELSMLHYSLFSIFCVIASTEEKKCSVWNYTLFRSSIIISIIILNKYIYQFYLDKKLI